MDMLSSYLNKIKDQIGRIVPIQALKLQDGKIVCFLADSSSQVRAFIVSDNGIDGISFDCIGWDNQVLLHCENIYHWSEALDQLAYFLENPSLMKFHKDIARQFARNYSFEWDPAFGLNTVSDEMLEYGIELVKHGFVSSLAYNHESNCVEVRSQFSACEFADAGTLLQEVKNAYFDSANKVNNGSDYGINWLRYSKVIKLCNDVTCSHEMCLTALCGYIEYAASKGLLPGLLAEREKNKIHQTPFEFDWLPEDGLRFLDESSYRLARQIVDSGLVSVERSLDPANKIRVKMRDFCSERTLSSDSDSITEFTNADISECAEANKSNTEFDNWISADKDGYLKTECSDDACINCHHKQHCVFLYAGYIRYLLDCGREDIIVSDRDYYETHKEQIERERNEGFGFTLRTDLFMDRPESLFEIAELLQENNYVSICKIPDFTRNNPITVHTFCDVGPTDDLLGLKQHILDGKIDRTNPKEWWFNFDDVGYQFSHIALAAYIDYLRKIGEYEQYCKRLVERRKEVKESFSRALAKLPVLSKVHTIAKNEKESSLYCIIEGDRGSGKHDIARSIADTLAQSGKIFDSNYWELSFEKLASWESYQDSFDFGGNTRSYFFSVHKSLDEHQLYVLTGLREFLYECRSISEGDNSRASHLIEILGQYRPNTYIIILDEKKYIERFLELSPKIKFLFGNNVIHLDNLSPEELYEKFTAGLSNSLKQNLAATPDFRNRFLDYIALNRKLLPLGNRELSDYLADYANNQNQLILPPDVYRKQSAKEMLESIIGMKNVKKAVAEFEKQALFGKRAEMNGMNLPHNNLHMVFTGNPGTGKTMIARVIAQMLFDFGIVPENKLVEVDRKDLVAGYIGQTAIKTGQIIDKAMGGVLFVDEAYSLASKSSNDFGAEAIATLIKAMEDHKDKFVVIFAGYEKEMHDFLNINPGISSRIGYTFKFEDYTADELTQMFDRKMKNAGFEYGDEIQPLIKDICDHFVQKRNFGNGRFVDKVIQRVMLKHSSKAFDGDDLRRITTDDIPSIEEFVSTDVVEHKDYRTQLDDFIGMENVKAKVRQFEQFVRFQQNAKAAGAQIPPGNMHMIFAGNPGTGKTTIARIMVDMLYDIGILKENKLIEVERKDLVAGYIGQTATKTAEVIERAIDGVLFVDEAYSLASGSENDFGAEAVATLIKAMEDHKNDLIVIFAGYKDEMRQFLDINPGISSRIGYTFDFEDYTPDELTRMYELKLTKANFTASKEALKKTKIIFEYFSKRKNFGNGRFVGKLVQETFMQHSKNIRPDQSNLLTINEEDIPEITDINNTTKTADTSVDFEHIIGMNSVKNQVKEFERLVNFSVLAREHGLTVPDANMHMIFTGNPGTGKTTIARIIARKLYDIGVIKENKLVETERKDLIAGYIGQTAQKVAEVIDKAMGGVLFVDEAYSLTPSSPNDFGGEAIATLIKAMEDHKDDLVVIFAGYKDEMRDFEDANPGISSRIGFHIHFDDYSADELREIFITKLKRNGFTVATSALEKVEALMQYFCHVKNFGNGRFVDKIIQNTLAKHAKNYRLDALHIIDEADIPEIPEIAATMSGAERMVDPGSITQEEHRRVAYHELGHAFLHIKLFPHAPIAKININAEGNGSLGYVEFTPHFGVQNSRTTYKNSIAVMMAGLAAEKVFLGDFSDGGSGDINKASGIAKSMIECGMSKYGFVGACSTRDVSKQVSELLDEGFESAIRTLELNRDAMNNAFEHLLKNGCITEEELKSFFR